MGESISRPSSENSGLSPDVSPISGNRDVFPVCFNNRLSCSSVMASARQDSLSPPEVLYIDLQEGGDHDLLGVSGRYQLHVGHTLTNGMPVWRKSAANGRHERWLFSCTGRKWCIHG